MLQKESRKPALGSTSQIYFSKHILGLDKPKIIKNKFCRKGRDFENDKYLKDKLTKNQIKKINETEDYLTSQIDKENNVEVEKVERYINLLRLFYALDVYIEQSGPITIVKTQVKNL